MPAANLNFTIEQGSDFNIIVQYNDNNNNGIDLSSKCVVVRWKDESNNIKVFTSQSNSSLDPNNGGYVLSGDNTGSINFTISSEVTKNYSFSTATYDLDILETIGSVNKNTRLLTGDIALVLRNFDVITDCSVISSDTDSLNTDEETSETSTDVTPTPTPTEVTDLCLPEDCIELDVYSVVYTGSGINIEDNSEVSGYVEVNDSRNITNVELAINNLKHSGVQDLALLLAPPSGDKILLSAHDKITNYNNNFSFMFSNKALVSQTLNNVTHGGICNITDRTDRYNYSSENLNASFNHLFGHAVNGDWYLHIRDDDIGASGSIGSWKLIITYEP
jgi:subtilisin-like proprotein convertase family protein